MTGLTAGALGGTSLLAACASDADRKPDPSQPADGMGSTVLPAVGVQLYTVRSLLEDDFVGTMETVANMGYDEVEFAGYYGRSPQEVKDLLARLDLAAPSTHVMPADIRERPQEIVETASTIGHEYVVCAYLTEADRGSLDAYREVASLLEAFGTRCADAGLQLAYHNHAFEFQEMEGTLPYDLLLQETSPETVKMELDLYWIEKAGYDPLAYFEKHDGRFPLCHVKDITQDGQIAPVGEGTIDFARIFERADQAGLQHYFVEHDNPDDPMASIRTSLNYMAKLSDR